MIVHVSLAVALRVILAKEVLWCKMKVVLSDPKLVAELLGCDGGPDVVGMTHTGYSAGLAAPTNELKWYRSEVGIKPSTKLWCAWP